MSSLLARQLGKKNGFVLPQQEAYLLLTRAAGQLAAPLQELFKRHGLTESSYNVLKIVRGHGPQGVPSQSIGPLMVQRVPDITRLVDRLIAKDMVTRRPSEEDRRVTYVVATAGGKQVLKKLDREVEALHREQFAALSGTELPRLIKLLEKSQAFDD